MRLQEDFPCDCSGRFWGRTVCFLLLAISAEDLTIFYRPLLCKPHAIRTLLPRLCLRVATLWNLFTMYLCIKEPNSHSHALQKETYSHVDSIPVAVAV